MNQRRAVQLLATLALSLAACGGDDGGGDLGAGDDFSVTSALGELPAFEGDATIQFSAADLVAASEANGVEQPEGPADEAWFDWLLAVTGGLAGDDQPPVVVIPPTSVMDLRTIEDVVDATGFSFLDADAFATAAAPPAQATVYAGSRIADVELDGELVKVADSVVSTSDRPDLEQDVAGDDLAVDRLGRPVRFAQDDDQILATLSTPMAEAWLAGDGETLADDESLVDVAGALDDADVVSASIIRFADGGPGLDDRITESTRDEIAADGLVAPYRTLGLGWTSDDGDAVITAVYDFGDEDMATEMVEVLEGVYRDGSSFVTSQPIADLLELDSIEADGPLVVATMRPGPEGRPISPYQMVQQRDLPFASS